MSIGSPQTDKFPIGTAEIRLSALADALKHLPSHSMGCLDDCTISITNNKVQKKAGFPQRQVAEAVTENVVSITGTVAEYSRRNFQIMGGEAAEPVVPDVKVPLKTAALAGATTLELNTGDGAKFQAKQLIVAYVDGHPEQISILQIDSIATDTLTLSTKTPTLFAYPANITKIFAAQPIGKAITKTEYMSCQVLQSQFSDGRPIAWNFWKVSGGSGLELAMNATDFSTTQVTLNAMEPAATDFQTGGPLNNVADIIAEYPIYMCAPGG